MEAQKTRLKSFIDLFLPFIHWLPELKSPAILRADFIAGITVALVLIPQSMAYAQLAGLPPYFGLYAAFLPPMVASIFGSSRQLATGPVAVVSLLSAAALEPLATAGSESFIAYSILLALLVGIFQFLLGVLRMGVLINFLSHPVVLGFTNAAAIIIATSQLGKIFGVSVEKSVHHYETVWNTLVAASTGIYWPTFAFAVLAFTIMAVLKRVNPRIPNVLVAVTVTVLMAWVFGFEKMEIISSNQIRHAPTRVMIEGQKNLTRDLLKLEADIKAARVRVKELIKKKGRFDEATMAASSSLSRLKLQIERRKQEAKGEKKELMAVRFKKIVVSKGKGANYYLEDYVPAAREATKDIWSPTGVNENGDVILHAGGRVVGNIPSGIPSLKMPKIEWDMLVQLFVSAIAIGLIGFMEAISIAKAMAARTRQHLDVNQELVGQGISNMVGSFFQSYAVSGSFSRSAVNIGAGAVTGFSSVVTSMVVGVTLLWLTPLLYYLPQATLAAVIMMAVIGLVNIRALKRTWTVERGDGVVAVTTFILTLAFAPHLEWAIMIGVILSLGFYLYRTMRPRVSELARHGDSSLRDAAVYGLQTCGHISVIRFEGSLYFANISYFEDKIMQIMAKKPELRYFIFDGVSINQIDASGVEMLESLIEQLQDAGVVVLFTRIKQQVMRILKKSGFYEHVGEERFFRNNELALEAIWEILGDEHTVDCPLNIVCPVEKPA